jgi:hypothetical protein
MHIVLSHALNASKKKKFTINATPTQIFLKIIENFKAKKKKFCNVQHEKKGFSRITADNCEQHRHNKIKQEREFLPKKKKKKEIGLQYSNLIVHCIIHTIPIFK